MASRSSFWPAVSVAIGAIILLIALPTAWKPWAPSFLRGIDFHLGLDLAGGTQLDFRVSEDEIRQQLAEIDRQITELERQGDTSTRLAELRLERQVVEEQQQNLIEAIRTVLERRINALGVSEATITPSYVGDEKHLLVECPGVVDVQKCIETVGKTIQLEFKEEESEASPDYVRTVQMRVDETMQRITQSGITLATLGQDLGDELGVGYQPAHTYFRDELPKGLEALWEKPAGQVQRIEGSVPGEVPEGQTEPRQIPGVFLVEVLSPKTQTGRLVNDAPTAFAMLQKSEQGVSYTSSQDRALDASIPTPVIAAFRSMQPGELKVADMGDGTAKLLFLRSFTPGREVAEGSHILVAYAGASEAPANVTRTKEQALAKAHDLKRQIDAGATFEDIARRESDGASKVAGGKLGVLARGDSIPEIEAAIFTSPVGQVSTPIETQFGYHLVRTDKAPAMQPDTASFDSLTITGPDAPARAQEILTRLQTGKLTRQDEALTLHFLFFSLEPTGWKDTALDGKHFRSAAVTLDPTTNFPVVQIVFDEEGGRIFQELTRRNIGKRIAIFVGGELVSAPVVQSEIAGGTAVITGSGNFDEARLLAQDLNTGAIPAPIHLTGQRTVEATLGAESLAMSVQAALIGIGIVMLYMLVVYRFLGVLADLALTIYAVIFLAILKLPLFLFTSQYIVLTLAGAAGMILSIGMAVDTNVLVFERVKEELRKGKLLKTAIETGFEKAWPSIRDSNIATLITCALLFLIGTSIVRGFAVTLGMGVIVSMFTGMVISRWLARRVAGTSLANRPELFPGMRRDAGSVGPANV